MEIKLWQELKEALNRRPDTRKFLKWLKDTEEAKNCIRVAIERVEKGLQYAYRDRRNKKRDFRGLWIQRINAAVRDHDMIYSQFIHGLKLANIDLNRKMLSEIAIHEPETFKNLVEQVKGLVTKSKDSNENHASA